MAKFLANFLGPFKIYFDFGYFFGYFYQKLGEILTKPSGHTERAWALKVEPKIV